MDELDLTSVAKRVVWFNSPADTLEDKNFFLAQVMTFGTLRDIRVVLESYPETDFEAVLDDPPPGVFDVRSWTFWNVRYHRHPVPPLPTRRIP